MTSIYPNIVPENNLRLPDALTIKHGPAPLLSRFVLEGDKAAREIGVRLRLRHDFDDLVYVNKHAAVRWSWYPLLDIFNPEYSNLVPENSYWISGEDEHGEIVLTQAGRVYYWPDTTLEQEARMMFCGGHEKGQRCMVTAADAKFIRGVVFYGGSGWVRPDFRGRRLMRLVPRLGRAYALARWPVGNFVHCTDSGREGDCRRLWLQTCKLQPLVPRVTLGRSRGRARQCVDGGGLRRLRRSPRQAKPFGVFNLCIVHVDQLLGR
jgi:hypothetical protein